MRLKISLTRSLPTTYPYVFASAHCFPTHFFTDPELEVTEES